MKSSTLTVVGILFMAVVMVKADFHIGIPNIHPQFLEKFKPSFQVILEKFQQTFEVILEKYQQTSEVITACKDKITPENFIQMIKTPDALSTNEEVKCLKACIFSQLGLMKENKLEMEQIEEKINTLLGDDKKETANSIIDAMKPCVEEANQSENECDVAGSFGSCMKQLAMSKMS